MATKRTVTRRALTKKNFTYLRWRYFGNAGRTLGALVHALAYPEVRPIASEIEDRGIVVGPSYRFLTENGNQALADASQLVLAMSQNSDVSAMLAERKIGHKKDYLIHLVPVDYKHSADSPLLRLALDPKLLEIVSTYFGMWPRLHAIGAWLNFPTDEEAKESQLWHRDPEDLQLIKVFIYLAEVDKNKGPFTFIPMSHPFGSCAAKTPMHKDRRRITDDEMLATFASDVWQVCTGSAGMMILADTVGYHRGGKPRDGQRLLITFTYTSGTPLKKRLLKLPDRPPWITSRIQYSAF